MDGRLAKESSADWVCDVLQQRARSWLNYDEF
jgi:hypothetical protein